MTVQTAYKRVDEVSDVVGRGITPKYDEAGKFLVINQKCIRDGRISLAKARRHDSTARKVKDEKTLAAGDVLVNSTGVGTLGRTAPLLEAHLSITADSHVTILRPHQDVSSRWFGYAISLLEPEIENLAEGSTGQTELSRHSLAALKLFVPPLAEQRAIAATLGALDDKIESNRRATASISLLLDARSEKVGADLTTVPLGAIGTPVKDTVNPSKLGDEVVDHFSLPAFDSGARPERVSAATIKSNKLRVPQRAVLISRLNPRFNRTWWVSTGAETSALASTEFLVLTSADSLNLAAIWLAVRDPYFREELPKRVTGTSGSHQRVRPDDLLAIEVPDFRNAAPEVKQSTLALLMQTESLRIESDRLTALRDALLPELLSGRIRVPVEEVAP